MSRSFWSRLTGAFEEDTSEEAFQSEPAEDPSVYAYPMTSPAPGAHPHHTLRASYGEGASSPYALTALEEGAGAQEEEPEGELSVDLYDTSDELIVKAIVAGVKPDELDIAISRDLITIRGSRLAGREAEEGSAVIQEVFWGTFSRTLSLPSEVDIENAQATVKDGVLTVRLPKIDKHRQRKIKVKSL